MKKGTEARWPPYPIGPLDSVFAIGVVSTKFTELESILRFIFSTVFSLSRDDGLMMLAKIGNEAARILLTQKLPRADWPTETNALLERFVAGFAICNENRGSLMHSGFAWTGDRGQTILFKQTKKGRTHAAVPTLEDLRKVADDIHLYCDFGRALGNAINNNRLSGETPIFPPSAFDWPTAPPLPKPLEYSGEDRQLSQSAPAK